MAFSASPFIEEVRSRVVTVLTDVTECTEIQHLNRIAWPELEVPFAGLNAGRLIRARGYGVARLVFTSTFGIWVVLQTTGPTSPIRDALEDLMNALYRPDPGFEYGQVVDIGDPDYSDELEPNRVFAASGLSQRAGLLPLSVVIAEEE